MTCIVKSNPNIRGYITNLFIVKPDRVLNHLLNIASIIYCLLRLFKCNTYVIKAEQGRNISSRSSPVNRPAVSHLKQQRDQATMIKMMMRDNDCIQCIYIELGDFKIRICILSRNGYIYSTIQQHS